MGKCEITAYRFRVKLEWDPTSLWRDIAVGEDRTLEEFQAVINEAMGLGQDHLWFFGADQDYWQSDVKHQRPEEYEDLPSGESMRWDETVYNAGETAIAELATQLDLEVGDRICYLFDYGDEWQFYGILKGIRGGEASDTTPEAINEKGESVVQYPIDEEPRYHRYLISPGQAVTGVAVHLFGYCQKIGSESLGFASPV